MNQRRKNNEKNKPLPLIPLPRRNKVKFAQAAIKVTNTSTCPPKVIRHLWRFHTGHVRRHKTTLPLRNDLGKKKKKPFHCWRVRRRPALCKRLKKYTKVCTYCVLLLFVCCGCRVLFKRWCARLARLWWGGVLPTGTPISPTGRLSVGLRAFGLDFGSSVLAVGMRTEGLALVTTTSTSSFGGRLPRAARGL